MNSLPICCYCQKQITGKPFIPVNSVQPYHWKCYISKIKTNEEYETEIVEEYEVEKVEVIE